MSTNSVYLFLDILNVGCGPDHPKVIIEKTFVKLSHCFPFPTGRRTREQFRFILLWSEIKVRPHSSYLYTSSTNLFCHRLISYYSESDESMTKQIYTITPNYLQVATITRFVRNHTNLIETFDFFLFSLSL